MRRAVLIVALLLPACLPAAAAAADDFSGRGRLVVRWLDGTQPRSTLAVEHGSTSTAIDGSTQLRRLVGMDVLLDDGELVAASARPAEPRTYRTLVIPVTFADQGAPTPFTGDEIGTAFNGALERFLERASDGAVGVRATVAPWVTLSTPSAGCEHRGYTSAAASAARAMGFEPNGYDRVAYLTGVLCGTDVAGVAELPGRLIWLNRELSSGVVAHEFGHTLGAGHAGALHCDDGKAPTVLSGSCELDHYGDPLDVMGNRSAKLFSTFHRSETGTLPGKELVVRDTREVRLERSGAHGVTLLRIPRKRAGEPVRGAYALELRALESAWDGFAPGDGAVTGLTVRLTGAPGTGTTTQLLDLHPGGSFDDAQLGPGERYDDPEYGIAIRLRSVDADGADVEITAPGVPDDVAPSPPQSLSATRGGDAVELHWYDGTDDESEVRYEIARDGAVIATVRGRGFETSRTDRPDGAAHAYTVTTVDDAGNRSAPATARVAPVGPAGDVTPPVVEQGEVEGESSHRRDRTRPHIRVTSRLHTHRLRIVAHDRSRVRLAVWVSGRRAHLRAGVLRLSAAQRRRARIRIVATDVAGNRRVRVLRVRDGRVV